MTKEAQEWKKRSEADPMGVALSAAQMLRQMKQIIGIMDSMATRLRSEMDDPQRKATAKHLRSTSDRLLALNDTLGPLGYTSIGMELAISGLQYIAHTMQERITALIDEGIDRDNDQKQKPKAAKRSKK